MNEEFLKWRIMSWFSERNLQVRDYQVKNVGAMFKTTMEKILLFDATGAGKTTEANCFMDIYREFNPGHNILVLAHGSKVIKGNFVDSLSKLKPNFVAHVINGDMDTETDLIKPMTPGQDLPSGDGIVIISLPQNHSKINTRKFDLIIVDEPHEFYGAVNVQKIMKHSEPKKRILMTATPRKFLKNKDEYEWLGTDLYTLRELGFACNIKAMLALTAARKFDINKDYDNDQVKNNIHLDVNAGLEAAMVKCIAFLRNPLMTKITFGGKARGVISGMNSVFTELQKTIIYSKNVEHADDLWKVLSSRGIKTSISHHKEHIPASIINAFRTDDTEVLVVVNMARLGFNFENLYNIIDFTFTMNCDIINQMMGRLARNPDKEKDKGEKLFIKIVPANLAGFYYDVLTLSLHLLDKDFMMKYGHLKNRSIRHVDINQEELDEWDEILESERKARLKASLSVYTIIKNEIVKAGGVSPSDLNILFANIDVDKVLLKGHIRKIVKINNHLMGIIEEPSYPSLSLDKMRLDMTMLKHLKHKDDADFKTYAYTTLDDAIVNMRKFDYSNIREKEAEEKLARELA